MLNYIASFCMLLFANVANIFEIIAVRQRRQRRQHLRNYYFVLFEN